jgi:hypothetical protein
VAVQQLKPNPQSDTGPLLLTVKDVQRLCQVSRHAALSLCHEARPVWIGGSLRIRPEDLRDVLARRREQGRDQ